MIFDNYIMVKGANLNIATNYLYIMRRWAGTWAAIVMQKVSENVMTSKFKILFHSFRDWGFSQRLTNFVDQSYMRSWKSLSWSRNPPNMDPESSLSS